MTYIERRDDIVWAFAGLVTVLCLAMWRGQASTEQVMGILTTVFIVALVVVVISRLSVKASRNELSVSLGTGFFCRRIQRESIAGISLVPPPSPFGIGMRLLPDGWLYSLSAVAVLVEVRLTDGPRL